MSNKALGFPATARCFERVQSIESCRRRRRNFFDEGSCKARKKKKKRRRSNGENGESERCQGRMRADWMTFRRDGHSACLLASSTLNSSEVGGLDEHAGRRSKRTAEPSGRPVQRSAFAREEPEYFAHSLFG